MDCDHMIAGIFDRLFKRRKSPEEYEEVKESLNENHVKLMVAMICRFIPHYKAAKKTIEKGELGSIVSIHAHRRGRSPPFSKWFWDVEKSGGIAVDLAIHDIDLIQWFIGPDDPIETVYAIGSNRSGLLMTVILNPGLFFFMYTGV